MGEADGRGRGGACNLHATEGQIRDTVLPGADFLAKGSFIWVIVKTTPTASDGNDLFEYLEEESLFRHEERDPEYTFHKRAVALLNASPSGPAKPAAKAAPHASLSMGMFRQLMAAVSPMEVVTRIVTNVLRKTEERPEAGKGERRDKKRQNTSPATSGDEGETDQGRRKKKAKGMPKVDRF
ncbi:hypothetical protein C8R44DRAFT_882039 [Mycena epipterygia]|nr:hypothetical protein C8R44DRAFT_882039 [Mycena epipterygia]